MSRKSMRCCSCLPAMHILLNSDEPRGARPRPPAAATMLLSSIVDGDRPRYVCFATELLRVGECWEDKLITCTRADGDKWGRMERDRHGQRWMEMDRDRSERDREMGWRTGEVEKRRRGEGDRQMSYRCLWNNHLSYLWSMSNSETRGAGSGHWKRQRRLYNICFRLPYVIEPLSDLKQIV